LAIEAPEQNVAMAVPGRPSSSTAQRAASSSRCAATGDIPGSATFWSQAPASTAAAPGGRIGAAVDVAEVAATGGRDGGRRPCPVQQGQHLSRVAGAVGQLAPERRQPPLGVLGRVDAAIPAAATYAAARRAASSSSSALVVAASAPVMRLPRS
jgi:hypothetical protein